MTAIEQIFQSTGAAPAPATAGLFGTTVASENNAVEFATQIATALEGTENATLINVQSADPLFATNAVAATSNYTTDSVQTGVPVASLAPVTGVTLVDFSAEYPDFATPTELPGTIQSVNAQIAAVLQGVGEDFVVEATLAPSLATPEASDVGDLADEGGAASAASGVSAGPPQEASVAAATALPATAPIATAQLVSVREGFELHPFSATTGIAAAEQAAHILPVTPVEAAARPVTAPIASVAETPAATTLASGQITETPIAPNTSRTAQAQSAAAIESTTTAVTAPAATTSAVTIPAAATSAVTAPATGTPDVVPSVATAPTVTAPDTAASVVTANAALAAAPQPATSVEAIASTGTQIDPALTADASAKAAADATAQVKADEKAIEGQLVKGAKNRAAEQQAAENNNAQNPASASRSETAQAERLRAATTAQQQAATQPQNQSTTTSSDRVGASPAVVAQPSETRESKSKDNSAAKAAPAIATASASSPPVWTPERVVAYPEALPTSAAIAAGLSSLRGEAGFSENLGSLLGGKPSPALSAQVAKQLNLHVTRAVKDGNNEFNLRLNPGELGSVRVKLTFTEAGRVAAQVFAERPETLELLQREARGFERAVEAGGHKVENGGLNFSLDTGDGQSAGKAFADAVQQDRLKEQIKEGAASAEEGEALAGSESSDLTDLAALEEILSRVSPLSGLDVRV